MSKSIAVDQNTIEQEARLIYKEMRSADQKSQSERFDSLRDEWLSCIRSLRKPYSFLRQLNEDVFHGRI